MHRPLAICAALVFATLCSAAPPLGYTAAQELQQAIPGSKVNKAPKLPAVGGQSYLVWRPIDGAVWTWPKEASHAALEKWIASVSWVGRLLVTEFANEDLAEAFAAGIQNLPDRSQLGVAATRRGNLVAWGHYRLVNSVRWPEAALAPPALPPAR